MKAQPKIIIISGVALAAAATAHGAVLINFDSESTGDLFAGGVSGWTQDSTNPTAFGQTFPLAYIATTDFGSGATNAGHLGTQFANTPDNSATTVARSLSGITHAQSITLNLGILDSAADSFTGRDAFSVTVSSAGSSTLAQIGFTPTLGNETSWNISLGVNGAAASLTAQTLQSLSGYIFKMNFGPGATTFSYGPQGGAANVLIGSRSALSSFALGEISMTHTPISAAGTSANNLVFDNINIAVPEPSSSVLLVLGLAMVARRRR
jgi:hypothetical protein